MILQLLTFEEGFRSAPYLCSEGFPTIGIGKKIGCKGVPLSAYRFTVSKPMAELWLKEEVDELMNDLLHYPWFRRMDRIRQDIIVSMAYQIGIYGLLRFKKMIHAIATEDYLLASQEALDSKWATQTPERAQRHAAVLATGDIRDGYADLWT